MAILYVTEFTTTGEIAMNGGQMVQVARQPPNAEQTVTYGASSIASSAFAQGTRIVRLHTDGICSFVFTNGATTATTSNARMIAGQTEYFQVPLNGSYKVVTCSNT